MYYVRCINDKPISKDGLILKTRLKADEVYISIGRLNIKEAGIDEDLGYKGVCVNDRKTLKAIESSLPERFEILFEVDEIIASKIKIPKYVQQSNERW